MSESDNLPEGGTDTADPLSLDDAANLAFDDPSEDTEEGDQEQQSEAETDEAEEGQEADETDPAEDDDEAKAEEEGTADEADKPEPKDDVTVTVNGEKVALSDLKAGYMRQSDYSRKTQEVASNRKQLEALSARVNQSVSAIAEFLVQQLPPEPDFALLQTDPNTYHVQKAMREAAEKGLNEILSKANDVKDVGNTLTGEQRKEHLASENAKLAEAFPETTTQEGRQKFFQQAVGAAREAGWSDEEIGQVSDHRMFKLAHYAALGLAAEKAKATARAKVDGKPPVAPQKRQKGANATKVAKNREAMKRLARTGSIEDALAVDFD